MADRKVAALVEGRFGQCLTVASDDLAAERRIVVHKGDHSYPLRGGGEAMTLLDAVAAARQTP